MDILRSWAYAVSVGGFPLIALIGFSTHALFLTTSILVSAERWSARFRRVPVRVHRWMGIVAIALATFHLVMGCRSTWERRSRQL
jgi:DMSO/TMAO reductase YedYZ heme-binding membrane subunit